MSNPVSLPFNRGTVRGIVIKERERKESFLSNHRCAVRSLVEMKSLLAFGYITDCPLVSRALQIRAEKTLSGSVNKLPFFALIVALESR